VSERLADSLPVLRRLYREANVPRLLAIAGRVESGTAWALHWAAGASLIAALLLVVDWLAGRPGLAFPPLVPLLGGGLWGTIGYLRLRIQARDRQANLERALSQSLTEMAILTHNGQMTVEAAVELIARAQSDKVLYLLMKDEGWRQLVDMESGDADIGLLSTPAIYERIGIDYEVPMFRLLASGMTRMNEKGLPGRVMLTNLARSVGEAKLAELNVQSERARVRMTIPIGLMVIPLLILIGYPSLVAIAGGFSH
jgi:hypothetical protein